MQEPKVAETKLIVPGNWSQNKKALVPKSTVTEMGMGAARKKRNFIFKKFKK